jgi:hypothetical protein
VPPGERWEQVPLNQARSTETHRSRLRNIVSVTISF